MSDKEFEVIKGIVDIVKEMGDRILVLETKVEVIMTWIKSSYPQQPNG